MTALFENLPSPVRISRVPSSILVKALIPSIEHGRGLLADLVVRQELERAHQCRVVPRLAAMGNARVEELLRSRRVGQGQAECLRALQRQIQVLLMQLDAKARIEGALHHALAMHFEYARGGEA